MNTMGTTNCILRNMEQTCQQDPGEGGGVPRPPLNVIEEMRRAAANCNGAMKCIGKAFSDWADRVEALIRNAEELATFKSNVLRELPTLPKDTFPGEAAGNAIRDLREALQWYVDNDDTNDTPDNKFWLEGRERARKALGEFNPEQNLQGEETE